MTEQNGYAGKILKIDLTTSTVTEIPSSTYLPKYFGGRGLGAKIYWDEVTPEIDALSPENPLIFTTGPLTATGASMSSGGICVSKSPLTYPTQGYWVCYSSGMWSHEVKFAGYDAFIIKGKAQSPAYILINDDKVEILPASLLWGRTTTQTRKDLRKVHGEGAQVACIGPAGEHLVIPSIISTDSNTAFAVGGFGAVMGSKNLKAIVVRGTGNIKVSKPGKMLEINEVVRKLISIKQGEVRVLASTGKQVPNTLNPTMDRFFPIPGNATQLEEGVGQIRIRMAACPSCVGMCKRKRQYTDGSLSVISGECQDVLGWIGAEQMAYGGRFSGRLNWEWSVLTDDLGLDNFHTSIMSYGIVMGYGFPVPWSSVSPGGASMWLDMYWEAAKRGILTEKNTGLPWSKFGTKEFLREFLYMYAYRKGFGDILAKGDGVAVKYIMEHEEFGPRRQEMEWLFQKNCPRPGPFGGTNRHMLHKGYGSGHACSTLSLFSAVSLKMAKEPNAPSTYNFNADFMKKYYGSDKTGDNNYWGEDLPKVIAKHDLYHILGDSAPRCDFNGWPAGGFITADASEYFNYSMYCTVEYLNAIFDEQTTEEKLLTTQEMFVNLERCIRIREGMLNGPVDTFYDCIFEETDPEGNILIPKDKFDNAILGYYQARGWKSGVPTRAKLESLGMKDVADALQAKGIAIP